MKAKVNDSNRLYRPITLELTTEEVGILLEGIGKTSDYDREKIFPKDCAKLLGEMWNVVDDAQDLTPD